MTRKIPTSEITPEHIFLSRRAFLGGAATMSAAALLTACGGGTPAPAPTALPAGTRTDELGDPLNTFEQITSYNNYYEFTVNKEGVARLAQSFQTSPWEVQVGGLVNRPRTFAMEDLLAFEQEERIYRLRCVEAWSMAVPWSGFPLADLVAFARPLGDAKYLRMETFEDAEMAPGQRQFWYPWPYVEGLTLAEATNELAFVGTGLYGKPLPKQNGAPLRLVTPWKYGFKSIKSIRRFTFTAERPVSFWERLQASEYGFWANVNPEVPHPRWSQATERVLGTDERVPTLLYNGYGEFVAHLYDGLEGEALFM